jgi:hypothetical protein
LLGIASMARADDAKSTAIPYKLTMTNHIMVRLKLNGKGPYNFILDTGAPTLIVNKDVAAEAGIKEPSKPGWSTCDTLDIEGGIKLTKVKCIVETPYQMEGMNALGVAGVKLDGLMGYTVVSRFKMDIDLTKDKMNWTPLGTQPMELQRHRGVKTEAAQTAKPGSEKEEDDERALEATGTLMKVVGPLFKIKEVPFEPQGFVGIGLAETDGAVTIPAVLGNGPADRAGIAPGDKLLTIDAEPVASIDDVRRLTAKVRVGQVVTFSVERDHKPVVVNVTAEPGM